MFKKMQLAFYLVAIILGIGITKTNGLTTHRIIMLLDNSEYFLQPSKELKKMQAVKEKTAPIITTQNLIKRVFQDKSKIIKYSYITDKDFYGWIYKKIDDFFVLLVPKLPYKKLEIIEKTNDLTELELRTGIKIDHLQTISPSEIQAKKTTDVENFFGILEKIFVTNSEYAKYKKIMTEKSIAKPEWAVFASGHGGWFKDELYVAGLRLDDFKLFLDFLNNKISTGLLLFGSCYSGGKNLELILKDTNQKIQKNLNFIIVSSASTEAATEVPIEIDYGSEKIDIKLIIGVFLNL